MQSISDTFPVLVIPASVVIFNFMKFDLPRINFFVPKVHEFFYGRYSGP